jgi:predicted phosphodiesterase
MKPRVIATLLAVVLSACSLLPGASAPVACRGDCGSKAGADEERRDQSLPLTPTPSVSVTPTPPPREYRFLAIGDWGTGWETQYRLGRRMCKWRDSHPYDIVVTAGDNIYETGHPDDFRPKFYRPFRCLLRSGVKFHAVLGNHDIHTRNGRPELNEPRFGMKGRNYVLRKSGIRFVMIDTNDFQREWVRKAVRDKRGDDWTIVLMHFPVFPASPHHPVTADFRPYLPRLFSRQGVDLVINGHEHLYAVTHPRRGVRYVTTGGGSASPHPCGSPSYTETCLVKYHFLSVTVKGDRLKVQAVAPGGRVFDRFSVEAR